MLNNRNRRSGQMKKLSMRGFMNRNRSNNNFNDRNTMNDNREVKELIEGSTGEEVENLQRMLNDLVHIYPTLPIVTVDGNFDHVTRSAVEKFQELNGLKTTGVVDNFTYHRLQKVQVEAKKRIADEEEGYLDESNNIVKQGSKGRYVVELQKYLNKVGEEYVSIPKLAVDGIFGPKTNEALMEFQRLFGLKPTGIADDGTWDVLYNTFVQIK